MVLNNKRLTTILLMLMICTGMLSAQNELQADSIPSDSVFADSIGKEISVLIDTTKQIKADIKPKTWIPDPKRALWLALVIPGGGQIYNRKYWKLPIVYGGFLGCLYAMNWNNTQYKDYSQAYLDITDDDPRTDSYNKFLHLGTQITTASDMKRYTEIFKNRKDKYRRWRDLSFFVLLGVYALSVIDAYVDAELSVFDISTDLSLKVEPTIINNHTSRNPFDSSSVGLQCSLNF
ncbi:MAG: hypothetical protein IKQ86_07060 [Prevotella sp.]|jgi:hypothetical protein|nr:hypothetical protein [Prevotella sp.]